MTTPQRGDGTAHDAGEGSPRSIRSGRLGSRLAQAARERDAERARADAKDAEIAALRQTVHALIGCPAEPPPPEFVMAYRAAKRGSDRFHVVMLGQGGTRKGFVLDAEAIRRAGREPEQAWPEFLRMMG